MFDADTGQLLRTLAGFEFGNPVFSPDGHILAEVGSLGGSIVLLRDGSTGQLLRELEGHTGFVVSVAFSPDGRILASGGSDGTVRLWGVRP